MISIRKVIFIILFLFGLFAFLALLGGINKIVKRSKVEDEKRQLVGGINKIVKPSVGSIIFSFIFFVFWTGLAAYVYLNYRKWGWLIKLFS